MKPLTINQVVAFNLMRARRRKGWSQHEAAERLTQFMGRKWTNATYGAAERSWETGRVREFDGNELAAFSQVFGQPIPHFLLPPDTIEKPDEFALGRGSAAKTISAEDLRRYALAIDPSSEYKDAVRAALNAAGLPLAALQSGSGASPGVRLDEETRRAVRELVGEMWALLAEPTKTKGGET